MPARREFLMLGGGALVTLGLPRMSGAAQVETVQMKGTVRGERVWFAPTGLAVSRGSTVRFTNLDPANSHTATVYHPDLFGRHLRIPEDAEPWDSGFLLPEESFEVTLTVPGVYDYYCIPHEMAGMVGRIVVGHPGDPGWQAAAPQNDDIAPEVQAGFPPVADIIARGRILKGGTP